MKGMAALFEAGMKQMSKNRLITVPVGLALLYPLLVTLLLTGIRSTDPGGTASPDTAFGVIFMTVPMAATLATGFIMILGSSLLPEEISAGRAGYWIAQPVSRNSYFSGMTAASFAISCVVTSILFYGTSASILAFLPYRPAAMVWAFACPLFWTAANLALVTLVSLVIPRIASIIVCLAVAGVSNFLGSVSQVADAVPQGAFSETVRVISTAGFFIFPADPMLRLAMAGLRPADSSIQEMITSMGFATTPPAWQIAYAVVWSAAVFWLAAARFRRTDLA